MPDITTIINDLKQVGALIPEKEWADKCVDGHGMMLNSIYKTKLAAFDLLYFKRTDAHNINNQSSLINTLEGQGFLPSGTRDMLEPYLEAARTAIKDGDCVLAASKLNEYSQIVENYLPQWTSQCACVKKGNILENIADGINVPSPMQISDTDKAATWTNIMLKLSDSKIITPEEANDLISNWK